MPVALTRSPSVQPLQQPRATTRARGPWRVKTWVVAAVALVVAALPVSADPPAEASHGAVESTAAPAAEPASESTSESARESASAVAGRAQVDFASQVRPLLAEHCAHCHGVEEQESGLRLDTLRGLNEGGNRGRLLVPGASGQSRLLLALLGQGGIERMPADADPLPDAAIDLVRQWIDEGARLPSDEPEPQSPGPTSTHWAFQPLAQPVVPAAGAAWVRNPIDSFVAARLAAARLEPSAEADRSTLLRRVYLDLAGLLPSPQVREAFLLDNRPDAYERVVDALLASPHYGERWGRHWLDLARYGDSNGYTIDSGRSIWKYRDWVIAALNSDLSFDRFAIAQLAGDLLDEPTLDDRIATGFHRNTLTNEEGGTDPEQFRVEAVVDRVSTTGTVFLGLTLGCARCHDHKYDPISQREFYRLFAIFNGADEPLLEVPTDQQAREEPALAADIRQYEERLAMVDANSGTRQAQWEALLAALAARPEGDQAPLEALSDEARAALTCPPAERSDQQRRVLTEAFRQVDPERVALAKALDEARARYRRLKAAITTTLVMQERNEPRATFVHLRGDFLQPGVQVDPGVPGILPPLVVEGRQPNRLDFARWLFRPDQPLTARVTVNRVWQQYFGRGLVATENDFGTQGEPPTHPELLDWLAGWFIEQGYGLKALHRLIVTSATYRQASSWRPELAVIDPENKLLARQNRLRLDAEIVRDAALSASGLLVPEIGGPGVYPPQPEGIYAFTQQKKYWQESQGPDRYRRTMYTFFWRSSPHPFLATFDAPDGNLACTRRVRSNTPLQALTLANDRGYFELARGLAGRLLREVSPTAADEARVTRGFELALARRPLPGELAELLALVAEERAHLVANPAAAARLAPLDPPAEVPPAEAAAWTAVARVLLNLDEFVTRE